MDGPGYLPCWRVGCATLPQVAARVVLLAGAIADEAVLADIAAGLREVAIAGTQAVAGRADIAIVAQIIAEVCPLEGAVAADRLVEYGDVRLDIALVDEPRQHLGRAIPCVRCQPFGPDAEAVLHALDHPFAGGHLGLPDRGARLHVYDDGADHEFIGRPADANFISAAAISTDFLRAYGLSDAKARGRLMKISDTATTTWTRR